MKSARMILLACLLATFAAASSVTAPAVAADSETVGPRFILSTNPILDLFTWFNAEFEIKMAPNSSIGVSGSFISFDDGDETYMNLNGFYRFYPQGKAMEGFFFGGRLGFNSVSVEGDFDEEDQEGTMFGVGIDIGYTWLMGNSKNFALSLGIGAVRYFGGDLEDVAMTLPTVRLVNVGIGF